MHFWRIQASGKSLKARRHTYTHIRQDTPEKYHLDLKAPRAAPAWSPICAYTLGTLKKYHLALDVPAPCAVMDFGKKQAQGTSPKAQWCIYIHENAQKVPPTFESPRASLMPICAYTLVLVPHRCRAPNPRKVPPQEHI